MKFHPEFADIASWPSASFENLDEVRQEDAVIRRTSARPRLPKGISVIDQRAPDLRVRIYRNKKQTDAPALVYFHGGAFIVGNLDTDYAILVKLASRTPCTIVAVDYRLAPEHPFPAGVDDCYAALCWTAANARNLGIDPSRIAVAGSSAGGALAAACTLMARDRKGPPLIFQMLIYPVLDNKLSTPSMKAWTATPIFNRPSAQAMWRYYLGETSGRVSPYAAPMRSKSFSGLPPAYIVTAEIDPLRDEGIEYASRLQQAGVEVRLHNVQGVPHGFDSMSNTSVARQLLAERIAVLQQVFALAPSADKPGETPTKP
jgi:acetyl esterase